MIERSVMCSVSLAGQGFPIFFFDGLLPRVPMSRSAALFGAWCLSPCGVRPYAHSCHSRALPCCHLPRLTGGYATSNLGAPWARWHPVTSLALQLASFLVLQLHNPENPHLDSLIYPLAAANKLSSISSRYAEQIEMWPSPSKRRAFTLSSGR